MKDKVTPKTQASEKPGCEKTMSRDEWIARAVAAAALKPAGQKDPKKS
ncbi:MAG: hypothetical protein KJO35_00255 [Gammaproteobacteria bacterium]|nr:hypothetical protein [Gammaproteobacteria bacterium]NNF66905.1 hypothetical protein [Gammaproteobacteria bacterium]